MNLQGVTATISSVFKPSILLPKLVVASILDLDFKQFKLLGINGIIIDKDNCITKPGNDQLEPQLLPAWNQMLHTFGPENILIVSNSAGTNKDPILLQAESVSRNMHVPVLIHSTPKPGHRSARGIIRYFNPPIKEKLGFFARLTGRAESEQRDGGAVVWKGKEKDNSKYGSSNQGRDNLEELNLLVIGDRLATDMILSHRLNTFDLSSQKSLKRIIAVPILTTTLHAREGLGTTFLRTLEKGALLSMRKRIEVPNKWQDCKIEPIPNLPPTIKFNLITRISNYWQEYLNLPGSKREFSWTKKWGLLFDSFTKGTESIIVGVEKTSELKLRKWKQVLLK